MRLAYCEAKAQVRCLDSGRSRASCGDYWDSVKPLVGKQDALVLLRAIPVGLGKLVDEDYVRGAG